MISLKRILVISLLLTCSFASRAQQDAMFSHYMFNTQSINPGYVDFYENFKTALIVEKNNPKQILDKIKEQEFLGYAYDGAEASFELLAKRIFQRFSEFYNLESFKVSDEKRNNLIKSGRN